MPLQKLISSQKAALERAFANPQVQLIYIGVDPEVAPMLLKLIAAIDADEHNDDLFLGLDAAYQDAPTFFADCHASLQQALDQDKGRLALLDINPQLRALAEPPTPEDFAGSVITLANSLGPRAKQLILVMVESDNFKAPDFAPMVLQLHQPLISNPRKNVKLAILGQRGEHPLQSMPRSREGLCELSFHIAPEDIEGGIQDKLKDPKLPELERLRYITAMAGFAAARKEFEQALSLGNDALGRAEAMGDESEIAAAHFNLGNTTYRQEDWLPSRAHYEAAL